MLYLDVSFLFSNMQAKTLQNIERLRSFFALLKIAIVLSKNILCNISLKRNKILSNKYSVYQTSIYTM